MSDENDPEIGSIAWTDLTIENAEEVRDFYREVVGWNPFPLSVGDYRDFNMNPPESGNPAASICHARGANAGLPAQWMIAMSSSRHRKDHHALQGPRRKAPHSHQGHEHATASSRIPPER